MSLITALTTHVATAGALVGALTTVLTLSGIAVLWSRATDHQRPMRAKRPRRTGSPIA
jgi:hypothetical protein